MKTINRLPARSASAKAGKGRREREEYPVRSVVTKKIYITNSQQGAL